MKNLITLFILFSFATIHAQVFHFNDSSTTLIKTTAQTPAHWYLEIYNDCGTDTMLRWKSHFVNIPPEWEINFDTQGGYFFPVLDGDSADFILHDTLDSPQKLIIGNHTNDTPGHGSVFFEIYDPNFPSYMTTIEYEFIITLVGVENIDPESYIQIYPQQIVLQHEDVQSLAMYDLSGRKIPVNPFNKIISLEQIPSGMYIIHFTVKGKPYGLKFIHLP